ncbi:RNA 2',3'-cyclic phosphodiesterase [Micromonospora polyrhachis]|uniref:RNA 2',3'-cyclic phosphodiesterase n=1 Tax=Micromonospora polyrhachis TaxID=1282883 RepID=A0A7W7WPN5_9ACTN|nr:RNA 2',3'-cyclic phosphodiesterase [Micromonospora polyrhachis]MBB4958428.1 2'-5' RNA ligase [Micromonospora polyrhachis]
MRLFVALYPTPEAVDDLTAQVVRLRIGELAATGVNVRLTNRETYHVTLAFLGEVDDARLPDLETALDRAARGWRGPAGVPVTGGDDLPRLRLAGGGRFGQDRSTVLWVGLRGDLVALRRLGAAVRRELRRVRVSYDVRPYRPHLTVARPGERATPALVEADRETLDGYFGPSWPMSEMVLVRSHLGYRSLHHRLASWPL